MIRGSLVALITPMHEDGRVDFDALTQLLNWHVTQKTDGIVILGTTGESSTLTTAEKQAITTHTIKELKGRLPVIVGTGSNATQATIDASTCAKEAGADACLVVTPYYNKPTQEGLYQHFKTLSEQVAIPHILYNNPSRTGSDLHPETVIRLAKLPHIAGIKEVSGELERCPYLREQCGKEFALYSGTDEGAMDFIVQGGDGVISVMANIAPHAMHTLSMAALSGDHDTARTINHELSDLYADLTLETNPTPIKWAAHHLGLVKSGIRLPLLPLSIPYREVLLSHLKNRTLREI